MKYPAQVAAEKKHAHRIQLLIYLTLLLIPALYILSFSVPRFINGFRLLENGTYTTGTVIDVEQKCTRKEYYGRVCWVRTIEFADTTGENIQFTSFGNLNLKHKKGEQVGLYYDPRNPTNAVIDDRWRIIRLEAPTIFAMSAAVIMWLIFGVIPVWKSYRAKK